MGNKNTEVVLTDKDITELAESLNGLIRDSNLRAKGSANRRGYSQAVEDVLGILIELLGAKDNEAVSELIKKLKL